MRVKLLSGTANAALADAVAGHLGIALTPVEIKRFNDGEIYCRVLESVRGNEIFIIQPTCPPANEHLMELLILVDALKRASAKEINAVIPYFGYSRQDRKTQSREPISGRLVANLLEAAGVHRVITFDLHAGQAQGFFNIPTDNLEALPIFAEYLLGKELKDVAVVSPDVGGSVRARRLAEVLDASLVMIDKRRPAHGEAEIVHVIGDVKGKTAIIVDDIIDSAGTIVKAADKVRELGATDVYVVATHPLFSGDALARLQRPSITEVIVTDTIPLRGPHGKVVVLSVSALLAEAIKRIYEARPMGTMFKEMYSRLR